MAEVIYSVDTHGASMVTSSPLVVEFAVSYLAIQGNKQLRAESAIQLQGAALAALKTDQFEDIPAAVEAVRVVVQTHARKHYSAPGFVLDVSDMRRL